MNTNDPQAQHRQYGKLPVSDEEIFVSLLMELSRYASESRFKEMANKCPELVGTISIACRNSLGRQLQHTDLHRFSMIRIFSTKNIQDRSAIGICVDGQRTYTIRSYKKTDTLRAMCDYEKPVWQWEMDAMMSLWEQAISKVLEQALGRPFEIGDAPRINLLVQDGKHDEKGVALDGQQIAWLKGEFVHRDGGVFYQVN